MLPFFFRLFNPAEANSTEEDPNRASEQTPTTPTQTTEIQGNTQELQQPQTPTTSPMPAIPTRVPLLPIQAIIPDIALMMRLFGPVAPLRIIVRQTIEQPTQGSSENQTSTPSTEAPRHVREIMFIFPPSAFPPFLPTEEQILNSLFNLQQPQGPPPASQQTIEKIPNITVTEEISSVQPRCSICCDDFMAGAEVAQLPCKHVFDRDCIVTWLKLHNTCPVCRFCVRGDEDKSKNEANPSVGENEGSREEENSGAVNLSANNDEDRATATNETQDNPKEVWEVESTNEIEKIKDDEMVIEEDLRRSTESNSTS